MCDSLCRSIKVDINWNVSQLLCDSEPAEACTNNYAVWILAHFFLPSRRFISSFCL
jgi:hypothetical protein